MESGERRAEGGERKWRAESGERRAVCGNGERRAECEEGRVEPSTLKTQLEEADGNKQSCSAHAPSAYGPVVVWLRPTECGWSPERRVAARLEAEPRGEATAKRARVSLSVSLSVSERFSPRSRSDETRSHSSYLHAAQPGSVWAGVDGDAVGWQGQQLEQEEQEEEKEH